MNRCPDWLSHLSVMSPWPICILNVIVGNTWAPNLGSWASSEPPITAVHNRHKTTSYFFILYNWKEDSTNFGRTAKTGIDAVGLQGD